MKKEFSTHLETKKYQTKYRTEFITITKDVDSVIKNSRIKRGVILIQTLHTTCGIWVNEDEKNLIGPSEELGYTSDLRKVLDNFASPTSEYGHNDVYDKENTNGKRNTHLCEPDENGVIKECINGHAHAQALMLHPSISLIVENGKLLRGSWQEIMLVELDHDRERTVSFLVSGEK
ncbi:MAG: YjbQ family protein [Candidatus Zambryskibacteria bacterium]|nr:YjbQ family protein [Candidatus Zambryskibacteria bacterium]